VLIVVDEIPAMDVLARHLQSGAGAASTIVKQAPSPPRARLRGTHRLYPSRLLCRTRQHEWQEPQAALQLRPLEFGEPRNLDLAGAAPTGAEIEHYDFGLLVGESLTVPPEASFRAN
jgi:hypothetical protein